MGNLSGREPRDRQVTTDITAIHPPPAALAEVADGRWYSCMTPELEALRDTARQACWRHTTMDPALRGPCAPELAALFAAIGEGVFLEAPFHVAYGRNLALGDRVYINADCVVLDTAPVRIGRRTMLGPAVQIFCPTMPTGSTSDAAAWSDVAGEHRRGGMDRWRCDPSAGRNRGGRCHRRRRRGRHTRCGSRYASGGQSGTADLTCPSHGPRRVSARHKVKLPQAALRFPLLHPSVVSVIPGAVSPKEVALNIKTMSAKIPKALWKELKAEGLMTRGLAGQRA